MQYQDVVIHTTSEVPFDEEDLKFPPVKRGVNLSDQLWVGQLDDGRAELIMNTCELKMLKDIPFVRQFNQRYAFVRELQDADDPYGWDEDDELTTAIILSRLVRPTLAGFEYAARIVCDQGVVTQIVPARIVGINTHAFMSPNRTRDWLTADEAKVLRDLIPIKKQLLPQRIHNALWQHEYAARAYYLDQRWTSVCTGLEALVHTSERKSTAHFIQRIPKLAEELGISISKKDASKAYAVRSQIVHGAALRPKSQGQSTFDQEIRLYDCLEDILRNAILRGMRDKAFGDIFRDDAQIENRWPLTDKREEL